MQVFNPWERQRSEMVKSLDAKYYTDPKIMKTAEKPRENKIVLITTKLFLFSIIFSKDVPEI